MADISDRQQHILAECLRLAKGDRGLVAGVLSDLLSGDQVTEETIYAEVVRRFQGVEEVVAIAAPDGNITLAEAPSRG